MHTKHTKILERFSVTFTTDNNVLEKIKRLRGIVFFKDGRKDEDCFDAYCDHLVVIDRETDGVVGAYRLLRGSVAKRHDGFYSDTEFDLSNIKKHCKGELLEMCRACVHDSYRRYPIINLLWKELIIYFAKNNIRYVFGCPSIESPDPEFIGKVLVYFEANHFGQEEFRVFPLKGMNYPYVRPNEPVTRSQIHAALPSLMRGYLKMGAVVCSEPVWDKEFGTADFFMLLDTNLMNAAYKKRFLC